MEKVNRSGKRGRKKSSKNRDITSILKEIDSASKTHQLFPDREPIYGGEEYIPPDPTMLMRDGKPWIPEDHGYRARIRSHLHVKKRGMGPYIKVPPEAGISFIDHPLVHKNEEGDAGKGVYLNGGFLCLCPLEESVKRRKFAAKQSNDSMKRQMEEAAEEAQKELGDNTRKVGIFKKGPNMQRGEIEVPRTKKKIWSVPQQIS